MSEGFIEAPDGVKLHYQWHRPTAPKATLLVVHGYGEHGGRYADLAAHLNQRDLAVLAFDYRGHGQSGGQRGYCDRFDDFLRDLETALAEARRPGLPLYVLGHSHGGLILLRALSAPEARWAGISGVILSSPYLGLAMELGTLKKLAGRAASRLVPRLSMDNGIDPAILSHSLDIVQGYATDRHCHHVATARWFTEAEAAQAFVAKNVGALAVPSLWLVAGADKLADATRTQKVYEYAGGRKSIVTYAGFFHEVLNEAERHTVYSDLDDWLLTRMAEPPQREPPQP
jgi:alpha-beta hydrolase superfamily lysophospholipase